MEVTFIELFNHLTERVLMGVQFEATRYAIGTLTVFFLIWVILAPLLKSRRIRARKPAGKQIRMEMFNSIRTVFVFVALDIVIFDLATNGGLRIYTDINDYGYAWFAASIVISILLHDTYFYWVHRAMHQPNFYKRFHMTHHRSHNPTPFTAYSFAVGEAIVEYAYTPILLMVMPMHPSALATMLFIMIFKNAIGHCGYELFPRGTTRHPILKHMTTVTHHDMHHEKANGNYGFYFTWWDKWMGTEHRNYEERFDAATQESERSYRRLSV